jgi:putative transposase
MFLTRVHKLNPTRRQHRALEAALEATRLLYNAALEERISAWRTQKLSIRRFDQTRSLTLIRSEESLGWSAYPVSMGRWPLVKLDGACKAFFSRRKRKRAGTAGAKGGFPGFRSKARFETFGFASWCGVSIRKGRLCIKGFGRGIRIRQHRPLPEAERIRGCSISRRGGGWTLQLEVETPEAEAVPVTEDSTCAMDWGVQRALTLHDGAFHANAKIGARYERKIRKAARRLARAKRGSKSRGKKRKVLAALRRKAANARRSWLHELSRAVVNRFAHIAVEELEVRNLTASAKGTREHPGVRVRQKAGLNRAILDGAPATLAAFLAYKAKLAGGSLRRFDPRGTSQDCAACGARVQKPLSQRTHSCACGWSVHRDLNAACNGYRRAWNRQAPLVAAFKIGGGVVPGGLNLPVGESGLGNI